MAGHFARMRAEIDRWRSTGVIDDETAGRLLADLDARPRAGFSFAAVFAAFAALLFGAAILLFVAANWEAIPRLGRVGLVLFLIPAGYVAGAVVTARGNPRMAEACRLVAIAAFGGAMALIGQTYHLSGDESRALLVWCLAAALSAAALRSGAANAAAVALAAVWLWSQSWDFWSDGAIPPAYPPLLAALWALSWWTRSVLTRHFAILSVSLLTILAFVVGDSVVAPLLLAAGAVVLFIAVTHFGARARPIIGIGGAEVHAMLAFGLAILLLHASWADRAGLIPVVLLSFAGSIGALVLTKGRHRAVRWLAYVGFGLELCLVYVMTIGTMLGTAGFLLATGLLLAISSVAILRFERRIKARAQAEGMTP